MQYSSIVNVSNDYRQQVQTQENRMAVRVAATTTTLGDNTNYFKEQLKVQEDRLLQRETLLWQEFLSTAGPGELPLGQLPMIPQQEQIADIPSAREQEQDSELIALQMSIPQLEPDPHTDNEQSSPKQDLVLKADIQLPKQETLTTADTQPKSIPYQDSASTPDTQDIPSQDPGLLANIPSIPQQDISQTATAGYETSLSFDTINRPFVSLQNDHESIPNTLSVNSYLEIKINGHWFPGYLNFEDATHIYYLLDKEGTRYELTAGMKVRLFHAG